MTHKSAILIPSRKGSTRLPSKATLKIKGKSMIEHLIDRMKLSKLADMIILCTTKRQEDQELVDIAIRNEISYFRGSENDILMRYFEAAKEFKVEYCANVDGDDIFCDSFHVDKTLEYLKSHSIDFLEWEGLPYGAAPIGFTKRSLSIICSLKAVEDTQTNWGRFFTNNENMSNKVLTSEDSAYHSPESRMTIDYEEDFNFAVRVFDELYDGETIFSLADIVDLLNKKPEIANINRGSQKKYKENLKRHQSKVVYR